LRNNGLTNSNTVKNMVFSFQFYPESNLKQITSFFNNYNFIFINFYNNNSIVDNLKAKMFVHNFPVRILHTCYNRVTLW
jgi:hypothetical protein